MFYNYILVFYISIEMYVVWCIKNEIDYVGSFVVINFVLIINFIFFFYNMIVKVYFKIIILLIS